MSRIPPPRGGVPRLAPRASDENKANLFKKPSVATRTVATKRPGESQVTLSEKRPRTDGIVKRTKSAVENDNAITRNAGFSERAKRAALKPIAETVMVRGSLPVLPAKGGSKAKRPAWDLKGRIQDMEEHFLEARTHNATLNERIAALEATNQLLHNDVQVKATMSEEASTRVATLEALLREKSEESESTIREKERTITKLRDENQNLERELSALKTDHETLKSTYTQETTALKSSITSLTCSKSGLQTQLDATEHLTEQLREEVKRLTEAKCEKERECEQLKSRVAGLEEKLLEGESTRRKLHNTIQELKGNIRVFCRIRPALPEELRNNIQLADISTPSPKTIEIQQIPEPGMNEAKRKFECSFDAVFGEGARQEEVFREISQLVQSAIDGYNVCVFAYGQTGSGKTYTMEGNPECSEQIGMIPRSVRHIFACIAELEPRGWRYRVEALFLEIYNERIQDLLHADSGRCEIIKSAARGADCLLSNVEASPVTCAQEVLELLKRARINRAVAATKCNEYSSRSHYVFQLKAYGENHITGEKCEGTLNLVDLAGSERVKESGSAGERLTEAKAINKSLSNLGKVIAALSRKDSHIPYRDSKLTHLLANSLGGNSKTLMFVNISPDNNHLSETLNSLRFATKVNQCNIGTAQKRVK